MKRTMLLAASILVALAGTPALAQQQPERANKAGEVRGKDRSTQVREMNETKKKDANKGKSEAHKSEKAKKKD